MENKNIFLDHTKKVLNFTHVDLDGVVSAIVLKNFFDNTDVQQINYNYKEDNALVYAKKHLNEYDLIIFTDFCPGKSVPLAKFQELGKPVLVLDHHATAVQWRDNEHSIFIYEKMCGAKLAYEYFKKAKNLEYLEEIVNITDDYDRWILSNKMSFPLNALYWNLGFEKFLNKFHNGELKFDQLDLKFFENYKNSLEEEWNNLKVEKTKNGSIIYDVENQAEISYRLREDTTMKYLIMLWPSKYKLSIRSDFVDLLPISKEVGVGGGHNRAMGYYAKDNKDLLEVTSKYIETLEKHLS